MSVDLTEVSMQEKIKRIAAYRGMTLAELSVEYNKRNGTKYVPDSFYRKLRSGAVRYDELRKIGEILNFDIDFQIKD